MSENSLKCRNKFVNKVVDKLNGLKNDIELLYKVDKKISRKIFKNINNQSGGANNDIIRSANEAQVNLLMKHEDLQEKADKHMSEQQEKLNNHLAKIQEIHKKSMMSAEQLEKLEALVTSFKDIIANMIETIDEMDINNQQIVINTDYDESSDDNIKNRIDKISNTEMATWTKDNIKTVVALKKAKTTWESLNKDQQQLFTNQEHYIKFVLTS